MVVCRYFAQGYCRYGERCRFEHTKSPGNNWNDNRDDDSWNERNSWRNDRNDSGYRSNKPSVRFSDTPEIRIIENRASNRQKIEQDPVESVIQDINNWEYGQQWYFTCYAPVKDGENFPEFNDLSPEELRWGAYQARKDGTFNKYESEVAELKADVLRKREVLKFPSPAIQNIIKNIFTRAKQNESTQNFPLKDFGFNSTTSSSAANSFSFKLPSGSLATENQTNIPSQTTSLFGNRPTSSPFGNRAPFGSSTVNQSSATTFSSSPAFGSSTINQPSATTFSSSLAFGSSTVNQPSATTFNYSGSAPSSQQISFGQNPSFGQPQQQQLQSTASNVMSSFSFAANKVEQPARSFGKQTSPMQSFSFNPAANQKNLFGATAAMEVQLSTYSLIENLTDEEKREFSAPQFTLGLIPEKPPAKEYI